ncbi:hypothetical protein J6590_084190 [Homalodisca vitripennis]|nr:hypothetical protein J6590_084190 [Homalodisca vitripennis]
MKCCVTVIVYLSMTGVSRGEILNSFSTTRNLLHTSTISAMTAILPDNEKEALSGSTDPNNNVHSSQFDDVQPHVNDLDSDLFPTPATHEMTRRRIQRPSFPTIIPPPGVIHPGMPTTTSTNPYGYSNKLRPDDPNKFVSVDSVPGQETSTTIRQPFHDWQPPSTPNKQVKSTQQKSRGDNEALVLPDSVSYVPDEEQSKTPERVDHLDFRYLVTSTTSSTPADKDSILYVDTRWIIDGPVKSCGPGMLMTANKSCRKIARK